MKTPAVLRPKSSFDRRLSRIEQQKVWEFLGKSIQEDIDAISWARHMRDDCIQLAEKDSHVDDDGKVHIVTPTMKLRCMGMALEFERFAHQVRKETFLDRTIPTLQRVPVTEVLGHDDEGTAAIPAHEIQEIYRQVSAEMAADAEAGTVQPVNVEAEIITKKAIDG